MSLINQEITYIASTNIGASCVLYEFSVSPQAGVVANAGFASLNNPNGTNNTLKLTFTVAGTYTVNVVARSGCSAGTSFTSTITQVVSSSVTNATQSGFTYLTPATRRFQFGNADGIKFLNQDGTVQYNQMRLVYDSVTNTVTDLDWDTNNYFGLPKSWRFDTEPFKTTPFKNIPIPTYMWGREITAEVIYYETEPSSFRYYPFQQSFMISDSIVSNCDPVTPVTPSPVTPNSPVTPAPTTINIPIAPLNTAFTVTEKAILALPTFSVYGKDTTSQDGYPCYTVAAQTYVIKDASNVPFFGIDTTSAVPVGQKCYNNHPSSTSIPVPFGDYSLQLTNKAPQSVVAGFVNISPQANAYTPYTTGGLAYSNAVEVTPNATINLTHSITDNANYTALCSPTHVSIVVALIVNGNIYQGEIKEGAVPSTYYNFVVPVNQITTKRLWAIDIAGAYVDIEADGFNRTLKVVASGGNTGIAEKHSFMSIASCFDNTNGWFNNNDGSYKHEHKMFNNKGNISGTSIINQDWI